MVVSEPVIGNSSRLPIGKAAELLGVSRDTLLRHTKQGLIQCGFSRANARRFYTGMELKRYWKAIY